MTIHKEGYQTIGIAAFIFGLINLASYSFLSESMPICALVVFFVTLGIFLFLISFFRIPNRELTINANQIICPADGKVVVIEEVIDSEYFKDKRIQLSVFMSPANVHVNRNPMSGEVIYNQYHKGKYLVAWHPKASEENERTTVVIENKTFGAVLYRQIAGALARRIVNYAEEGMQVIQGTDAGFIKFGSRVDLFFPLGTAINVELNQKAIGGKTIIATA